MSKNSNSKPTYEAPVAIPLGDLAKVHGETACHSGPTAAANCKYGTAAKSSCNAGPSPTLASCIDGTGPVTTCGTGTSPAGS